MLVHHCVSYYYEDIIQEIFWSYITWKYFYLETIMENTIFYTDLLTNLQILEIILFEKYGWEQILTENYEVTSNVGNTTFVIIQDD